MRFSHSAALLSLPSIVHGHGYQTSPWSRNFVAWKNFPQQVEYEPWSANTGGTTNPVTGISALCGLIKTGDMVNNYDNPKNAKGVLMPLDSQECYQPGQIIDVKVKLTVHHKGHFEFFACGLTSPSDIPTKTCFDENPLMFVSEVLAANETRAPAVKDTNFPRRAYVYPYPTAPFQFVASVDHEYTYKYQLPAGLSGDYVLLQWYWVTANSCTDVGYDTRPVPEGWNDSVMDSLAQCVAVPSYGVPGGG